MRGDLLPRQGHARVLRVRAPRGGRRCQDRRAQQLGRRSAAQPGVHRHAAAGRQRGRSPALRGLDGRGRASALAASWRSSCPRSCAGRRMRRSSSCSIRDGKVRVSTVPAHEGKAQRQGGLLQAGRLAHRGREPVHVLADGQADDHGQHAALPRGRPGPADRRPGRQPQPRPDRRHRAAARRARHERRRLPRRPRPPLRQQDPRDGRLRRGRSTRAASTAPSPGSPGRASTATTTACR